MPALSKRQQNILLRVVDEFASIGQPVSSAVVANHETIQLSSASVRAVMAELEELGFLFQPHTSAGRVPTPAGTRFYVNYLFEQKDSLDVVYRAELDREFRALGQRVETAAQRAGEVLSQLSSLTSIISIPGLHHVRLADIKLSLLGAQRVLAILIAQDARVFHRVVRVSESLSPRLLGQIQAYLRQLVDGQTLAQVRARVSDERRLAQAEYRDYIRAALEIGRQALEDAPGPSLHVEGALNILEQREFSADLDRLRGLLHALEEKDRVLGLLDTICQTRRSQALIGPELGWELGDDLSLIVCDYYRGDQHMGVVGVLGPIRMDYARIIPLVDYAATMLSRKLAGEG